MPDQVFPYVIPMMSSRGMMPGYPRMPPMGVGMPPMGPMGGMQPMPYPMPMPMPQGMPQAMPQAMPAIEAPLPTDKEALGEKLYTMVEKVEQENAAKITGMLLEMEIEQIHSIIKDSAQLDKWINEARNVLNSSRPS